MSLDTLFLPAAWSSQLLVRLCSQTNACLFAYTRTCPSLKINNEKKKSINELNQNKFSLLSISYGSIAYLYNK